MVVARVDRQSVVANRRPRPARWGTEIILGSFSGRRRFLGRAQFSAVGSIAEWIGLEQGLSGAWGRGRVEEKNYGRPSTGRRGGGRSKKKGASCPRFPTRGPRGRARQGGAFWHERAGSVVGRTAPRSSSNVHDDEVWKQNLGESGLAAALDRSFTPSG